MINLTAIKKHFTDRLFFYGCLLFSITLPLPIRYNNISIVIMAMGWLMEGQWTEKLKRLKETRMYIVPVLLYFLYVMGMLYSDNFDAGRRHLEVKSTLLLFPIIFSSSVTLSEKEIKSIFQLFVGIIFLIGCYFLGAAIKNFEADGSVQHFFSENLTQGEDLVIRLHPIYLANYVSMCLLILVINPSWPTSSMGVKIARLLLVLFFLGLILLLVAVSVLVFLFIFGGFLLFVYLHKRLSSSSSIGLAMASLGLFALVVLSVPTSKQKLSKMLNFHYEMNYPDSSWNTLTIRLAKWTCSGDVIKANPLFGVGTGDEQDKLMESYAVHNFAEGIRCEYNVHNQYLSTQMALGLLGLSMLVILLAWPGFKAFKTKNYLMLGFIILVAIGFLTENFLSVQKGAVFFSFFYCLLVLRRTEGGIRFFDSTNQPINK